MWQFWIDRGGTFTDVVAKDPSGKISIHKLLSENPEHYQDAAVQGMRDILNLDDTQPIASGEIEVVKMGTTVATNALLEKKGDRTVLAITSGFRDALRIAYQNRPDIFARQIILPELLYEKVVEIDERMSADGLILTALNTEKTKQVLKEAYNEGIRSCAIVFMHAYRYPEHERKVAEIACEIGFSQISVSHQVSPLIKLVSRGDTTVVDAYLSPILRRYVEKVATQLNGTRLMFMQSNGGLVEASHFHGKDSILSGPAGGIVGAVKTSMAAGFDQIIGFDMGGTSTDVSHFAGQLERSYETEIAGIRIRAPMTSIHTVAAGGGSILSFDGQRYRVGPESAGANPGPACYRRNGPLTITDCNVMVGKIQAEFFPKVFGTTATESIDAKIVQTKFAELANQIKAQTGDNRSAEQVAEGFLAIAVEKMANAIKKISIQQGHDVTNYTLCCFGGAGGQHACLIANALGMSQIFIHRYAGVLSAYGIGLADVRVMRERTVSTKLDNDSLPKLAEIFSQLEADGKSEFTGQALPNLKVQTVRKAHIRYEGTDSSLPVDFGSVEKMIEEFEQTHHRRFGFQAEGKALFVESLSLEIIGASSDTKEELKYKTRWSTPEPVKTVDIFSFDQWRPTPIYIRDDLEPGDIVNGPAMIAEQTGTNIVESGWQAILSNQNHLILKKTSSNKQTSSYGMTKAHSHDTQVDPVKLEIFNSFFMSIAEQMGYTLQNTASSVNIKERLDFSCAVFDHLGQLVANAPHMPVHLGSMSESVQSLIAERGSKFRPGNVYAQNNPYNGGTHLPDITVITPVYDQAERQIIFYVASRGHHADIGGITPGSMPPHSTSVDQEGVLINNVLIISQGKFLEKEVLELFTSGKYPARNPAQNIADLRAQVAANKRGAQELHKMVDHFGLQTVLAYMGHVQDNAEAAVSRVISRLKDGKFSYPTDDGSQINVAIKIDSKNKRARIDFTGTTEQLPNNFNAPAAICKAAVLYVFRTLVEEDLPLNYGCIRPLDIVIPESSMLNPSYPAAVVAGNVETSQVITDAMFAALGALASSQGTMNNFTFGNESYQYYETICGGSGAGPDFHGTDAVQTHMTNSRLTDPEILEWRFPVLVESFAIRPESGGDGLYKGGNGVTRRIKFRQAMTASILSSRRLIAPLGIAGGSNAQPGSNYVEQSDGKIIKLGTTATVEMQAGDTIIINTPGGAGFGQRLSPATES